MLRVQLQMNVGSPPHPMCSKCKGKNYYGHLRGSKNIGFHGSIKVVSKTCPINYSLLFLSFGQSTRSSFDRSAGHQLVGQRVTLPMLTFFILELAHIGFIDVFRFSCAFHPCHPCHEFYLLCPCHLFDLCHHLLRITNFL